METDGNLSVFPYPRHMPASASDAGITPGKQQLPVTIIEDGHLFRENLSLSGKDEIWLEKTLRKYKTTLRDTWLLTVDGSGKELFLPREEKP